jgi:hypothetical protein
MLGPGIWLQRMQAQDGYIYGPALLCFFCISRQAVHASNALHLSPKAPDVRLVNKTIEQVSLHLSVSSLPPTSALEPKEGHFGCSKVLSHEKRS